MEKEVLHKRLAENDQTLKSLVLSVDNGTDNFFPATDHDYIKLGRLIGKNTQLIGLSIEIPWDQIGIDNQNLSLKYLASGLKRNRSIKYISLHNITFLGK